MQIRANKNPAKRERYGINQKRPEESKIRELLESSSHSEQNNNGMQRSQKSKQSDKKSLKEVDQNAEF